VSGANGGNGGTSGLKRIEALLREKKLDRTLASVGAALSSEEREARLLATGWSSVDQALSGGFPRGECSEIVGSPSSGRSALATTLLAEATRRGEIVALVDTLDRFDPRAALEMGRDAPLDLSRLLWVRGTALSPQALMGAHAGGRARGRARPARRETSDGARREASDDARREASDGARREASDDEPPELLGRVIERALKSFGLIAQAGGFGVVALDLADVPMPALRRLPFTTWFRLQRLLEGSQTVGILLAREPVGRSARGVTVLLDAKGLLGAGGLLGARGLLGAEKLLRTEAFPGTEERLDMEERCLSAEEKRLSVQERCLGAEAGTRVIWTGTSDCARVLAGFALRPQVQSARRLGDQLRNAASA
jgi:recombination protein RecA